jgi:hypothetical protein
MCSTDWRGCGMCRGGQATGQRERHEPCYTRTYYTTMTLQLHIEQRQSYAKSLDETLPQKVYRVRYRMRGTACCYSDHGVQLRAHFAAASAPCPRCASRCTRQNQFSAHPFAPLRYSG